ncbi:oxidoreductase [Roseomonas sp. KE2513]|nr:oxidoreductase [Roseomonas sp. KE2513]
MTISGKIQATNGDGVAKFDRPMLNTMGSATIVTSTPWHDGPVRFDGVPMAALMEAVRPTGDTVTAFALNDYSVDLPLSDFTRFGVLLATHKDGAPMRVRDQGPLFIIYPFDSALELRTRLYYDRSAWSVVQLIIR